MTTRKQIKTAAIGIGAFIGILAFVKYWQISSAIAEHANFAMPPESVTSVITKEEFWDQTLNAVGSLAPVQGAVISAEEPGTIAKVTFESGARVKKGDPLLELDSSVEEANLKEALAGVDWAEKKYRRIQDLRKSKTVSQESLDDAQSEFQKATAVVESLRSKIAKRRIVAPFDGQAGIRTVNIGQYVAAGTPLFPLFTIDPIYINFSLPQQYVGVLAVGQKVNLKVDAFPDQVFEGAINAINPQVTDSSRSIELQAIIPNKDEKLRPGMFANVSVVLPTQDKVIALPSTSINYAPYGDTVYVIEKMKDPAGKEFLGVRQQVVKTGNKRGEQIAVVSGLKPGDEVATSGLFKLRPGAPVAVNNSIAPGNSLTPTPADS